MKKIDLSNVQEAGSSTRPVAGAYVCEIKSVEDLTDKEYLKIGFDITEGEYAGYYSKVREEHPDWDWGSAGVYCRSYKPTALGMFKRMCSAVTKSNPGYAFDGDKNADEKTLVGKKVGIVLREEEYYGNDGEKRTRVSVQRECPIEDVPYIKAPAVKKVEDDGSDIALKGISAGSDETVPW